MVEVLLRIWYSLFVHFFFFCRFYLFAYLFILHVLFACLFTIDLNMGICSFRVVVVFNCNEL